LPYLFWQIISKTNLTNNQKLTKSMKHLFLTILLCTTGMLSFSQTKGETLEWLNVMKPEVTDYWSLFVKSGPAAGKTLEFTETQIKVYDKAGNWTTFNWGDIKYVKHIASNHEVKMLYSGQSNGQTHFISLLTSAAMSEKFFNAIKHITQMNGAKFVNPDLFESDPFGGKIH
jgi:hypothetical protein